MKRIAIVAAALLCSAAAIPLTALAGDELSIGSDQKTGRPNVFIAWRNTHRILETEIEVKNYGGQQAAGQLRLEILDENGNVLDFTPRGEQEPVAIVLPPAELGGREGRIVQMHGTKEINLLIDRLDRANERYSLRAMVVQDGKPLEANKNIVAKTFNVSSRVRPGAQHFYDYYVVNHTGRPVDAVWQFDHSPLPDRWVVSSSIEQGAKRHLEPGESVQGILQLTTPPQLVQGQHADFRLSATDPASGQVIGMTEWYAVYDTLPPVITAAGYEADPRTGTVRVQVTAVDDDSMIKEASGARVEYSTDDGTTFSSRVLAYADGNFVGPTRFLADLGPFAPGTKLTMTVVVEDIAGNKTRRVLEPVQIENRHSSIAAPAPAPL
jgi:hypothetical protein